MARTTLDWPEVNCILDALQALIDRNQAALAGDHLDEDERADLSNELSHAQILRGKYKVLRDAIRNA